MIHLQIGEKVWESGWSSPHFFTFPESRLCLSCLSPFFLDPNSSFFFSVPFFHLIIYLLGCLQPSVFSCIPKCGILPGNPACSALSAGSKEEFAQILLTEAPAPHGHQDLSKFHFAASTQSKKLHQVKTTKGVSSKRVFWTRISSFIWGTLHNITKKHIAAGLLGSWFFLFFISIVEATALTLLHTILLVWNNSIYKTRALKPFSTMVLLWY